MICMEIFVELMANGIEARLNMYLEIKLLLIVLEEFVTMLGKALREMAMIGMMLMELCQRH